MGFTISLLKGIVLLVWLFLIFLSFIFSLGLTGLVFGVPLLILFGVVILVTTIFNGVRRSRAGSQSLTRSDVIFFAMTAIGVALFAILAILMYNLNKNNPAFTNFG